MPNPSDIQPSLTPASPGTAGGLRRVLYTLLGVVAFCVLAFMLWVPLDLVPGVRVEMFGSIERFRFLGAALLAALVLAQFLIRPPGRPSRKRVVWEEFASATGGTVSQELRWLGPLGWTGGTTVRWDVRGIQVRLSTSTDTNQNEATQLAAEVRLARGFQFHLVQESLLAKAFFSEQLWNVALAAVKAAGRDPERGGTGAPSSAAVADRLAFMASKEIVIGDPKFDDAFLVKSDTAAVAREFLGDAGVAYCLHELDKGAKGWQLSLMSRDGASTYRLALALPGTTLDPLGLDASRKLIEASIRCLADRGMLASRNPQAA